MSDVVSILDPELRFEYTSPSAARVVGAPPEELTGRYAIEGVHEEDAAELTRRLKDVVEGRAAIREAICRYRLPDGDWGYFHSVVKPFDGSRPPHRLIVNSRDITESKRAEPPCVRARNASRVCSNPSATASGPSRPTAPSSSTVTRA
jgi:PAS domain S-box-containing protein